MEEPPVGTVTFLFTDIEGSTKLLHALGDRYGDVLAEHRRLLRESFTSHRGHEVDTQGDAFFVAFPSAVDAVGAAVAGQRALAAGDWPPGVTVKVRMGLHTGEPSLSHGSYVGMDVHRGARIAAVAHGGQVLLSARTSDLAAGALPEGVAVRDLGLHRLKDLAEAERLAQLDIEGLDRDFPRVRSLGMPTNLPVPATSFVGRDDVLDTVNGLLRREDVRLVTLTGPGGIGKTRLALQAGQSLLDDFVNGVFVVPLASISDPELVLPSIAAAVGAQDADTVAEELRAKRVLLVLDNFEQVTDAAGVVATLLAASPASKAIVTSRTALRLGGEHQVDIPDLAVADAVRLFVERATAVHAGFRRPETDDGADADAAAIEEICRRLDLLPLAIELAAARSRLLTPVAMLARLDSQSRLLHGGPADAPARQRTLRDAIAWSYDLLGPAEQTVFRALAVFVGGCTTTAAEAVLPLDGADPLDVLGSLVEQSLLRVGEDSDGEPRFRMLETIREYAAEQLRACGEEDEVARRFAFHVAALGEEAALHLRGPDQRRWFHRLDDELDNVRAVLGWAADADADADADRARAAVGLGLAGALNSYWYIHGGVVEGSRWLEAALALAPPAPADDTHGQRVRARALHGLGVLLDERGEPTRAAELFEASLSIYELLGEPADAARELNSLGVAARGAGDEARAIGFLERSLAIRRELEDSAGASTALANLGVVALDADRAEAAAGYFEESLALDRGLGDEWGAAVTLGNLAATALALGDVDLARDRVRDALWALVEIGDDAAIVDVVEKAAMVAQAEGRSEVAVRLAGAADASRASLGIPLGASDQVRLGRPLADARVDLGDDAYAAAWAAGCSLSLADAVAVAMAIATD